MEGLGVSSEEIVASREGRIMKQFVMRTSLRDPASTAPVTLWVYDHEQARDLANYLSSRYSYTAEIEHVTETDVMKPEDRRVATAPRFASDQARMDYERARKAAYRAAKKAAKAMI